MKSADLVEAIVKFRMETQLDAEIHLPEEAFYRIKSRVLERAVTSLGGYYGRFGADVSVDSFKIAGITVRRIEKREVDKP